MTVPGYAPYGNQARAEDLGLAAENTANQVNGGFLSLTDLDRFPPGTRPITPEVEARVDLYKDVLWTLLDRRVIAPQQAQSSCEEAPVEDEALLASMGSLALSGATAAIGAVVGAYAGAALAGIASAVAVEFIKGGTKDVVDQVLAELAGHVASHGGPDPALDARSAFFGSMCAALINARGEIAIDLNNSARLSRLMALEDPEGILLNLTEAVRASWDAAAAIQRRLAIDAWIDLLAQADLGATDTGRPDVLQAVTGDAHAEAPRGVLRVQFLAGEPIAAPVLVDARIGGLNASLLSELRDRTPRHVGLAIVVEGVCHYVADTGVGVNSRVRIGTDGAGVTVADGDAAGLVWLDRFGRSSLEPGVDSDVQPGALAGARRLIEDYVAGRTFAELEVRCG